MKGFIAAKMSAMRKRSVLSSSAASSTTEGPSGSLPTVPNEPSSHRGKMQVVMNDRVGSLRRVEEVVDIVLCVAADSVHAVVDGDNSIAFEARFASLKEITWDHTECSVQFHMADNSTSPIFLFPMSLIDVEAALSSAIRQADLPRLPDQVYVGVLVGRNLPTSPIHQRRSSSSAGVSIPGPKRRELLMHERPPRNISPREKLGLTFFKNGTLQFPCSINSDARGLKLDSSHLFVCPSSDYLERSACLFSYRYDQIDSCDVRHGTRLELRFLRCETKQPMFIACQATDAIYVRDAVAFFKSAKTQKTPPHLLTGASGLVPSPKPRRRSSITSFRDENALLERLSSRCRVIGCSRLRVGSDTADDADIMAIDGDGKVWYCEDHASSDPASPSSPPRSPSKRNGFLLSRARSTATMTSFIHRSHYSQCLRYHSSLLKNGGKYQLTKAWNPKIVALIETPVGGLLCYYDKLAHCPGQSDSTTHCKERRVIDLASVTCIRRESSSDDVSPGLFAFDIVTVYRTWTFGTPDLQEYETWLYVLREATEKHSAKTPDTPVRYPVRCLRDPLLNLPSRNDGSTSLEVSGNGVTVISGTDGECEVYNWYFTEIQKWSVARQQDTPCCFLSCLSTPAGPTPPVQPVYHDFLFQTNDAEAICSTIEFFVSKCMAKLEVLSTALPSTLPISRRPSIGPDSAAAKTALTEKKEVGASKQMEVVPVELRPLGQLTNAGSGDLATAPATAASQVAKPLVADPGSAASPLDSVAETIRRPQLTVDISQNQFTEVVERPTPIADLATDAHESIGASPADDVTELARSISDVALDGTRVFENEPGDISPSDADSSASSEEGSSMDGMDGSTLDVHSTTSSIEAEDGNTHEGIDVDSLATDVPQGVVGFDTSNIQPEELSHASIATNPLAAAQINHAIVTTDSDGDRFQSFEYNVCTIGVADAMVADTNSTTSDQAPAPSYEDFQDALDEHELSIVVVGDEGSLVVLEDDIVEDDDDLTEIELVDQVNDTIGEDNEPGRSEIVVPNVQIPMYSQRKRRELVELQADYDESRERRVVWSVNFHRGRRVGN